MNEFVLGDAYTLVIAAWKHPQKTEEEFGTRLESYAVGCSDVYKKQHHVH